MLLLLVWEHRDFVLHSRRLLFIPLQPPKPALLPACCRGDGAAPLDPKATALLQAPLTNAGIGQPRRGSEGFSQPFLQGQRLLGRVP